jgi:hypothetical protein
MNTNTSFQARPGMKHTEALALRTLTNTAEKDEAEPQEE